MKNKRKVNGLEVVQQLLDDVARLKATGGWKQRAFEEAAERFLTLSDTFFPSPVEEEEKQTTNKNKRVRRERRP